MNESKIICPHCHTEMPLSEAVSHQIRQDFEARFEIERNKLNATIADREKKLTDEKVALEQQKLEADKQIADKLEAERKKISDEAARQAGDAVSRELTDLKAQLEQKSQSLESARKAEAALAKEKAQLQQAKEDFDIEMARKLEAERKKIADEAAKKEKEKASIELAELNKRLDEQSKTLKVAKKAELDLLLEKSRLEQAKEDLALEVQRKLTEERKKIADEARKQGAEQERLALADKDNIIRQLQEKISELKQSAEQGSMQAQGETLELEIENTLADAFPHDEIIEVKKGQLGADIIHKVRTRQGGECGTIVWEAKRAKSWSSKWVKKLKEDQREEKADIAVIVTTCPPDGVSTIDLHEGVWVCEPPYAIALATALRQGLIHAATQRVQQENRADKMSQIYDHLCSVEFRQTIESIVDSFLGLKRQLDAEKAAMTKQWKEREAQLTRAATGMAGLYGGIQGIAGREALPEIRNLALPAA
jgi:hypothetical protein